jgi:hypothetical protein
MNNWYLVGGQESSQRVVNKVQLQRGPRQSVSEVVEHMQSCNAPLEYATASLKIYVLGRVAGQRGNDVNALVSQKLGRVLLSWLEQSRQITTVNNVLAKFDRALNQRSKLGAQLRCSSCMKSVSISSI